MRSDRVDGDERLITTEQRMKIARGPVEIEIQMQSEWTVPTSEKSDSPPVLRLKQVMGQLPQTSTYRFEKEGVKLTSVQGESTLEKDFPKPDREWLTPGRASDRIKDQMRANKEKFSLVTLEPQVAIQPIEVTYTRTEENVIIPDRESEEGTPIRGHHWEVTIDKLPSLVVHEFYDEEFNLQRTETTMAGMKIVTLRATREEVMKELKGPELMVKTLIRPDKPLERPRELQRLELRLKARENKLPDLPTVTTQQITRVSDDELTIVIDLDHRPKSDAPTATYLDNSTMLNHEDEVVRKLYAEALRGANLDEAAPAGERAEALRRFVGRFIKRKDLDTGFASASEVAVRKTGDCSEHGVLLAALLRVGKIPSRVATGLMYVDEFVGEAAVFGYHMWTQAYVDGRWIDLDAVLGRRLRTDATHIVLSTSALADDESMVEGFSALMEVMGNLEIEVEKEVHENKSKQS